MATLQQHLRTSARTFLRQLRKLFIPFLPIENRNETKHIKVAIVLSGAGG